MLRKLSGSPSIKGATLADYGILIAMLSVLSIGSLAGMGIAMRDSADHAQSELGDATSEIKPGTSVSTDPNAGPRLADLSAADLNDIETYGARTYMDGTTIFLADMSRRGAASFAFHSATDVTMREDTPTCATGPFNAAEGSNQTVSCSYASTAPAPENRVFVRVPGDGWLERLVITDEDGGYQCYRDTVDAADPHTFTCDAI